MYKFERLSISPDAIADVATLMRIVWANASHLSHAYLQWLYAQNPDGAAVGFNAVLDGACVAHYATIPVVANIEGEQARGLLSLNTATHPQHQGKKLFTKLAEQTYEYAAQQGYQFVVGVANANSSPGFTRKLGFSLVTPLDARIGISRMHFVPSSRAPMFRRVWTEEAARWRLQCPQRRYACRPLKEDRSFIFGRTQYPMIDVMLAHSDTAALSASAQSLPKARSAPWLWLGRDNTIDWKRTRSITIPKRLRPSPLNLIFRSLGNSGAELDKDNLSIQAIDFDAY